jgi:iron complex outermembrane receptor protein
MSNRISRHLLGITAIAVAGLSVTAMPSTAAAQEGAERLEEIIVTARKREENLQEVPVSISVLGEDFIREAGILTQRDLFEMTPGIHYDEAIDRNSAQASVRGVQSNEIATNRTKVTAFLDGMPILGSQGSIQFGGTQQIEVYRGPQSAAFGRSTFAGAINYVSMDPGEEFAGDIRLDVNDYGGQVIEGSISGPMGDKFGYRIDALYEDSDSPDEYTASDGTQYGARKTEYAKAKLVFTPSDAFEAELTFSHVFTEDAPSAQYYISQESRDACFDGTFTMGMGGGVYGTGVLSCDWDQGVQIATQNDRTVQLAESGETNEDILFLAYAQSVPFPPSSDDTRDRVSLTMDFNMDGGSTLQVLSFYSEEDYVRGNDQSWNADTPISITPGMAMGPGPVPPYSVNVGMGATIGEIMSDPTEISETYAEVRWVSPGDKPLRWVLGAAAYDYDFVTNLYFGGYNAILGGQDEIDRYQALTFVDVSVPRQVFSETATNLGVFFNVAYDFTDQFTMALEGRYSMDDAGGTDTESGESGSVETKAFLPRLSFNYSQSETMSFYGQIAKGNNPGGVNVGFFNPAKIDTLDNGIPSEEPPGSGNIVYTKYVSYDSDTFVYFDEETLWNYELGMKGVAFDGRLSYATAIYYMQWSDMVQAVNLDWDDPSLLGPNGNDNTTNRSFLNSGDADLTGIEFEGTYFFDDRWSMRGTFSYLNSEFTDFCDVALINTGLDSDPDLVERAADSGRAYDCYNVTGNEVIRQPDVSFSLSPAYRGPIGGGGLEFTARMDIRHDGEQWRDTANVAAYEAVTIVNMALGLNGDRWSATLYGNNLTDENSPTIFTAGTDYSIDDDTAGLGGNYQSNYRITPRRPRTVGLRAVFRF